jgi:hypothetical protein
VGAVRLGPNNDFQSIEPNHPMARAADTPCLLFLIFRNESQA